MTWTQMARLWNDYGAFVTLVIVIAIAVSVGVTLLIKFWPILTKAVTIGTALSELPGDMKQLKSDIGTLRTNQTTAANRMTEHLEDAKTKIELLNSVDGRLDRIEEKAGIAASQTTNNGGSSMKDAVDRSERRLLRLEEALLALTKGLGHANDVPLTATGSITLTPDGAPTEH